MINKMLMNEKKIFFNCDMLLECNQRQEFIKTMNKKIGYKLFTDKIEFPIIFKNDYFIGGYTDLIQQMKIDEMTDTYEFIDIHHDF